MITNKLSSTTLDQILEVIKISKTHYTSGSSISSSVRIGITNVAKKYNNLRYQTIEDGCRRRLGLKDIDDFRDMLVECFNGNPSKIMSVLKEHTDVDLHCKINDFFKSNHYINQEFIVKKNTPELTTQTITLRLDKDTLEKLKGLLGLTGLSLSDWVTKTVKKKLEDDLKKLEELFLEK